MSDAIEVKKPKFQKLSAVTLPVISLGKKVEKFFLFLSPIAIGKALKQVRDGEIPKAPAMIAKVLDLETGELGICVCPTVLSNELPASYPDNTYVGKAFSIVVTPGPTGSRWNHVHIAEVAIPEEMEGTARDAMRIARPAEIGVVKGEAAPLKAVAAKGK